MKCLTLVLSIALVLGFGCAAPVIEDTAASSIIELEYEKIIQNPCLDQDVWVYIKHNDPMHPACIVVVHVPKHSLEGDSSSCPAADTKVVGEGRVGSSYRGYHVVVLKKGQLNDPKNFTTKPPKKLKIPANNGNIWHVSY